MRSRRLLALLLLLVVALSVCRGRADEVREEALASVEIALEITHERPGMVGGDVERCRQRGQRRCWPWTGQQALSQLVEER